MEVSVMKKFYVVLCKICSTRWLVTTILGISVLVVTGLSLPLIVASVIDIPDFKDTRVWQQTGLEVNYQDEIPFSVTRSYALRLFPVIEGASYAPIWDEDKLIYKAWGPFSPLGSWCHFQTFLRSDGWAPPMRSSKSEAIPRIDWAGNVALGFTLLMYSSNEARRASDYGVFRNPFLEFLDAPPMLIRF